MADDQRNRFHRVPCDRHGQGAGVYENGLGLKVSADYGGQWIEYGSGSGTFVIQTFTPDPPEGQRGLLAFEVDDLDGMLATLKEKGLRWPRN